MEKGVAETYASKVKAALGAIPRFISPSYYIVREAFIVLDKGKGAR
jgi:hypothetical protein